jgi:hypothetical protein
MQQNVRLVDCDPPIKPETAATRLRQEVGLGLVRVGCLGLAIFVFLVLWFDGVHIH